MLRITVNHVFGKALGSAENSHPMEIRSASVYRFSLPLAHTLDTRSGELEQREGLILILNQDEDMIGLGEISPLPGFSQDSLSSALSKTVQTIQRVTESEQQLAEFINRGGDWEQVGEPSIANYGIETALLSLLARTNGTDLGKMLFGETSQRIPLNGLINTELADWVPTAQHLIDAGYRTLKVKVGRINHELEALGIRSIRQAIGPEIGLRLDGNRSWDLETAIQFGNLLKSENVEYIEEPLNRPEDLPIFYDECGLHFALDETLHHILDPSISFQSYTGLKALILKPTLVACMPRIIELVGQAREQGIQAVMSSSYESDVGLNILAQLAAGISGEAYAVGLGTRNVYSSHLSKRSPHIQDGWMEIQSLSVNDLDLDSCELVFEKYV